MDKENKIEDLGYDDFFKIEDSSNYSIARVISEHKELYRIKNAEGEYSAKITGKQIFDAKKREDYPAVGDWVKITILDKESAIIHQVLRRRTILSKKYNNRDDNQIIATNVDTVFIVESLDNNYNLNRFERYLVLINEGKIKPAIILNKIDLISEEELNKIIEEVKNRFNNVDIILTSTLNDKGTDKLIEYIEKGKTYCFVGSSGVGKSSLINKLLEENQIKTGEISEATGKGKHTTTSREMYFLNNGGIVIDNPGTRGVGMTSVNQGIENIFDQIISLSKECKFRDCTHTHESGCAVLKAVKENLLDKEKYLNYIKIKREAEYYEMDEFEKREKDRKFGKFIKRKLKELDL